MLKIVVSKGNYTGYVDEHGNAIIEGKDTGYKFTPPRGILPSKKMLLDYINFIIDVEENPALWRK